MKVWLFAGWMLGKFLPDSKKLPFVFKSQHIDGSFLFIIFSFCMSVCLSSFSVFLSFFPYFCFATCELKNVLQKRRIFVEDFLHLLLRPMERA
jgi:dolichol kinase